MAANELVKKQRRYMIARRLKEVRTDRGLTGHELAAKIGCTQGMVSKYEGAEAVIDLDTLLKFCDAMECSVDYMLGRGVNTDVTSVRSRVSTALEKLEIDKQLMVMHMLEGAVTAAEK